MVYEKCHEMNQLIEVSRKLRADQEAAQAPVIEQSSLNLAESVKVDENQTGNIGKLSDQEPVREVSFMEKYTEHYLKAFMSDLEVLQSSGANSKLLSFCIGASAKSIPMKEQEVLGSVLTA